MKVKTILAHILRIKYTLYVIVLSCLMACSESGTITDQRRDEIVIFFEPRPVNNFVRNKDGLVSSRSEILASTNEISYVDDRNITRHFMPRYSPEKDTLVIKTKRDLVEVRHAFKGLDRFSFLFHRGDSVVFTYDGQTPIPQVLNRKSLSFDLNYDKLKRKHICKDDYPGIIQYDSPFHFMESNPKDFLRSLYLQKQSSLKLASTEYLREGAFLDSLHQNHLISTEVFRFFRSKNEYEYRWLQLQLQKDYKLNPQLPVRLPQGDTVISRLLVDTAAIFKLQNDSLLSWGFYKTYLHGLIDFTYASKLSRKLVLKEGSGSFAIDHQDVYDLIYNSNLLEPQTKKSLLLDYFELTIPELSATNLDTFVNRFAADVQDTTYIHYIYKKYKFGQGVSDELKLQTAEKQSLSFTDLLQTNHGKLIYIDFWASWCAPCIKALPASHRLRESYKNQDLAFIYISKDENYDYWIQGARKHGLDKVPYSYIIDNLYTSRLLEDLDIATIPRYLLYDKSGKLKHKNAPGPESAELRRLIDALL